ncbi:MAG TPA: hypothetical protein VJP88_06970 [Caulobacteraceae bacterium]|nr:hypothetical protein [Caulobacteraceae bacterium]
MDFMRSGRALALVCAAVAFAVSWVGAISSFGMVGLCAGWLPAAILALGVGSVAWLAWTVVALTVLLGWHCRAREPSEAFS